MKVEIINILDASGSMGPMASDTIGGFNSFIENQKRVFKDDDVRVTLMTFSTDSSTFKEILNGVPLYKVPKLTEEDYICGGMTALRDAIGTTLNKVHINGCPKCSETKVIVCITTDGMENSSREYTSPTIKELIDKKKSLGWEFIYQGADHDAFAQGASIGIPGLNTFTYIKSKQGIEDMYIQRGQTIASLCNK